MSTSAPFQVPSDLVTEFRSSVEGSSSISFFEVQVKNEQFVMVQKQAGTGNLKTDFNSFCSGATSNQASFFLYRGSNRRDWTFVTYVPEVPIKERMIYASAKGTLKDKLGHNNFSKELHFTNKSELSYSSVEEADRKIDVRSEFEKTHEKVLQEEDEARDEVAKRQTVSMQNSGGIGGYHAVQIPFSSSASSEVDKVKNGSANFVELFVDDAKSHINAQSAKTVAHNELKTHINTSEPRFYVYSKTAGAFVFIYCCPEKSPQKLRMVYSTSKPSVLDQIAKKGIDVSRKAEITEANEIGEALAVASSRKTVNFGAKQPLPEGGGTSKARAYPTVYGASPLASMMQQGGGVSEGATTKKKIVIPPASAW